MKAGGVIERRRAAALAVAPGRKLTGYAAVFGQEIRVAVFTEVIRPGAFTDALSGRDILCLIDHDPARLLARTKSGTLRLEEDAKGLRFELDVPDTGEGRDVLTLAERGDLGGMSFGFTVPKGGESWNGQKRELRAVTLHEISVIHSWPAYEGTSVEPRARTPRLAAVLRYLETL
jgi:HK97 family phage prohead protease